MFSNGVIVIELFEISVLSIGVIIFGGPSSDNEHFCRVTTILVMCWGEKLLWGMLIFLFNITLGGKGGFKEVQFFRNRDCGRRGDLLGKPVALLRRNYTTFK